MSHVRVQVPFSVHDDNHALAAMKSWCTHHVGDQGIHWSCEIVHMDYDLKHYTWMFHFDHESDAVAFALVFQV